MSQPGGTDRPPIPHAACSSSRLKGASWSTHSVLGRLRKSFVCLRAHSALKQTLDFETAPGTAGATTQGGEHCYPRREPGWKRPHATCKAVAFSPLFSRQPAWCRISTHSKASRRWCRTAGRTSRNDSSCCGGGQMRFAPVRDYRTKEHPGRSGATSLNDDETVHVNRRAPFGVVEIQAMTHDLFLRAFRVQGLEESHRRFAQRRTRARRV